MPEPINAPQEAVDVTPEPPTPSDAAADTEPEAGRTPPGDADGRQVRRITVNLRASDMRRIDAIARETGLSANEILRRALATESFVMEHRKEGRKILIEDDEAVREVLFPY